MVCHPCLVNLTLFCLPVFVRDFVNVSFRILLLTDDAIFLGILILVEEVPIISKSEIPLEGAISMFLDKLWFTSLYLKRPNQFS